MNTIRELGAKIEKIKIEQEALEKEIQEKYSDYYAIRYPQSIRFEDLRKNVLKPGETMLIYNVMEETTCLWLISEEKFREFHAERILWAVTERNLRFVLPLTLKPAHRYARELCQLLIPQAALPLLANTKILYIIPTGSLYDLLFGALITKESGQPQGESGQPQGAAPTDSDISNVGVSPYAYPYPLRQIKCDMIHGKSETLRHPFFWAPLVVFGDGR